MWNQLHGGVTRGSETRDEYSIGGKCTNNQVEYEGLLTSLELLTEIQVRNVGAFGDSKLIV
jgi:ribonuclease HI